MVTLTSAAVLREPHGAFTLENLVLDDPRPDEVLIKMVACGVCQTDSHFRDQLMPIELPAVLGHEGAGVVERVGSAVTSVVPGDHVVLSFNSCGHCAACDTGHPAYCDHLFLMNFAGTRADGTTGLADSNGTPIRGRFFGQSSFATFSLANERNVVKVPNDLPLAMLAPLGCGFQTGAAAVLHTLDVPQRASIAIFGVGAVGLAAIMASKIARAGTIIAIDVNDERLQLAQALGADHTINASNADAAAVIRAISPRGVDFVLDTSGRKESLEAGLAALAIMGKFGFVAFNPAAGAVLDASRLSAGQSLQGIVQGDATPQDFIPRLIEFYRDGVFPFDRLIRFYEPADIDKAFSDAARGETIKPVIRFEH
ncbi:NAD(P)-dependent alcohol dehydrogenase [Burkholderia guangdongensis]|uniref:NAD(P)-dependent alcohol dehydrogenase n=1 Tax=Burkholderia guangdongensis TaxID=1792500 RepID=UPI0015CD69C5|nr:NAD(P)-dependent alcohol dehydrogenase [Burkholderia guangdongensis]